jgi:hypothetical protein
MTKLPAKFNCLIHYPHWHVFRAWPGSKIPMDKWVHGDVPASCDREQILKWYLEQPDANWCLSCGPSGIAVVDMDTGAKDAAGASVAADNPTALRDPDGSVIDDHGARTLARLAVERGPMPETLMATTPRGGRHYYFFGASRSVNGVAGLGLGVDMKSIGGMVLMPGSRTKAGRYRWVNPGCPIADLPEAYVLPPRPERSVTPYAGAMLEPDQLAACLAGLDPVDFRDQDRWFKLMCACHHAAGDAGYEVFNDWCMSDAGYGGKRDFENRWFSLGTDAPIPITAATLFWELKNVGRSDLIPPWSTAAQDFADTADVEWANHIKKLARSSAGERCDD